MTIRNLLFAALALTTGSVEAAPPENDNFASRQVLSGAAVSLTATNGDATMEAGESDLDGLYGATVWYSWTAPAAGWVKVDTVGSEIDTVIRVSTGGTLAGQTLIGYNDQGGGIGDASSLTFLAVGGQVYNIAVGGYLEDKGSIALRIASGDAALPPVILSSVTVSPSVVDVTSAPADATVALTVAAGTYSGGGSAYVFGESETGINLEFSSPERTEWSSLVSGNEELYATARVSRFLPPSFFDFSILLFLDSGATLSFGSSESGAAYVLPSANATTLNILNSGPVDTSPPELIGVTVGTLNAAAPVEISVGPTATILPVRVVIGDAVGVQNVELEFTRVGTLGGIYAREYAFLDLTEGTASNGVWSGSIELSDAWTSGLYEVSVGASDDLSNRKTYQPGEIPGGALRFRIVNGGGYYALWAKYFSGLNDDVAIDLGAITDDYDGDGVNHLLCMAFDLSPLFGRGITEGSLPEVTMTGSGAQRRLQIRYRRHKANGGSGLSYVAQFSSGGGVWDAASGVPVIRNLGGDWEEVVVTDTVTAGVAGRRFGRVKVTYAE